MIFFTKYLKWFFAMTAFILGAAFLEEFSTTNDPFYMGIVVVSFGVVFVLSKSTYEAPKVIFISSVGTLTAGGIIARLAVEPFMGYYFGSGFYVSWFLCSAVIGLPVMIRAFKKED